MKLIYIANARIPTEKAHGTQIVRTCEALALAGVPVELWLPNRSQNQILENLNLFDFYDCKKVFRVKKIPCIDLLSISSRFGKTFDIFAYHLQELSFIFSLLFQDYGNKVIYTRSFLAAAGVKFFHRVPVYFEVHDFAVKSLSINIYRLILSRLNGIVTVTEGLRQMLNLNSTVPMTVITSAVDLAKYQSTSRQVARKSLMLSATDKFVVYTGAVILSRGLHSLLKAARILKNTDINFLLVGHTENVDEKKMKDFVEKEHLNRIIFTGHISPTQIHLYQKAADILVIPSGQGTYPWDQHGTQTL